MGKKRGKRTRCPSCGELARKKCKKCNSHHTQPRSRFGQDGNHNEVMLPKKEKHEPFHVIFANDRIGEAVRKVLFDWETVNPNLEMQERHSTTPQSVGDDGWPRLQAWNTLFGKGLNRVDVARILVEKFVLLEKDKGHLRRVIYEAILCSHITEDEYYELMHSVDTI